jgi:hypothetical protein
MSAIPPPPPATPPPAVDAPVDKPAGDTSGYMNWLYGAGIFSLIFTIVFHAGAAYLSYQKYQSGFWAVIDFFFAFFYYPYYSFYLASAPAPSQGVFAGGRRRKH